MSEWYRKVASDASDLAPLADALVFFETAYLDGLNDLNMEGKTIWTESKKLPGLMAFRYGQYREAEAIRDYLEILIKKSIKANMQTLWNTYNKTLSERLAEKWAEQEDDVIALRTIHIEFNLLVEKFAGLTKGIEQMHFQIGNLIKLREAGIEDATF